MSSNATSRLKKELRQLMKEPEPVLRAMPRANNLLVRHTLCRGGSRRPDGDTRLFFVFFWGAELTRTAARDRPSRHGLAPAGPRLHPSPPNHLGGLLSLLVPGSVSDPRSIKIHLCACVRDVRG